MLTEITNQKRIQEIYDELAEIFKVTPKFKAILAKDRNEFTAYLKNNKPIWVVGTYLGNGIILFIDPRSWEKDKIPHPKKDFKMLVKHEMIHLFIDQLSSTKNIPLWLNEGLAVFLSGQLPFMKFNLNKMTVELNDRFSTLEKWNENISNKNYAYYTSALFVEHLIDTHGFFKALKLIKNTTNLMQFNSQFKKIFKVFPKQAETNFVRLFNKKSGK